MNKEDITKIVDRYAVANAEKNTLSKEVLELGKAIKAYFTARGLTIFDTPDNYAVVSYSTRRTLDTAKLEAHFGGTIPDKFYVEKSAPVLTVKPRKAAAAVERAISNPEPLKVA